jgi:hypothetical protein
MPHLGVHEARWHTRCNGLKSTTQRRAARAPANDQEAHMTKLSTARSTNVNVLGESELEQVVGGYCHRRRRHYYGGKHCGGWRPSKCHGEKSYDAPEYESTESYESSDSYESTSAPGNAQIVNVSVTVDIAQAQG